MKKLIYLYALVVVISSCSKATVEPEPSDQVLGTYKGLTYIIVSGGVGTYFDLTDAAVTKSINMTFDVSKKSTSAITVILTTIETNTQGVKQTYKDTYDNIDLKNPVSGEYEAYQGANKVGKIGNGALFLEFPFSGTDPNTGKAITGKEVFSAKK